jgi:hypothetical protein
MVRVRAQKVKENLDYPGPFVVVSRWVCKPIAFFRRRAVKLLPS